LATTHDYKVKKEGQAMAVRADDEMSMFCALAKRIRERNLDIALVNASIQFASRLY
jgi:hypothetical protein